MASREEQKKQNIKNYYAEVHKYCQSNEYEKVIKSANKSEFHMNLINLHAHFKSTFTICQL